MTEMELQSIIIDYLEYMQNMGKLWYNRQNNIPPVQKVGGVMKFRRMPKGSKKGIADLIILMPDRTIFVELKSEKGKQSPEQKQIEIDVKAMGCEYYIVREFEEIEKIIE